jgi:organic hydroperoxide reductase OsmC/OhrA
MAIHVRTVTARGTSLGWTNGRSLTIDGSPGSQEQRVGFDAEELLGFAIGASYVTSLMRQAERQRITVHNLAVDVSYQPCGDGHEIAVSVSVEADVDEPAVMALIENADKATTIPRLLRLGVPVRLTDAHVIRK